MLALMGLSSVRQYETRLGFVAGQKLLRRASDQTAEIGEATLGNTPPPVGEKPPIGQKILLKSKEIRIFGTLGGIAVGVVGTIFAIGWQLRGLATKEELKEVERKIGQVEYNLGTQISGLKDILLDNARHSENLSHRDNIELRRRNEQNEAELSRYRAIETKNV